MPKSTLQDKEFGTIELRRLANSRSIKISATQRGTLQATLPKLTPASHVRKLIDSSRIELREILKSAGIKLYEDGMRVGKSHYILVKNGAALRSTRKSPHITIYKPASLAIDNPDVQAEISKNVTAALRSEAKKYLPERIKILASQNGYSYKKLRFTHAKTRWGSCSSSGTISLNIALMNLPFRLIDYVLVHELCHTRQMNHSRDFWQLVEKADPSYLSHRRELKKHSPTI